MSEKYVPAQGYFFHKKYRVQVILPLGKKLELEDWLGGVEYNMQLWHKSPANERADIVILNDISACIKIQADIIKRDYC